MLLTNQNLTHILEFFTYYLIDDNELLFVSEDGNTVLIQNGELILTFENPDFDFADNPLELSMEEFRKYVADSTLTKTVPMPDTTEELVKVFGEIIWHTSEEESNEIIQELREYLDNETHALPF